MRTVADATTAGTLLESVGRLDEAYILLEAAHAIDGQILGADHPLTIETRAALARVQGRRGRVDEAQVLWTGWVKASQRALSDELWMVDEATRREVLRNNRRNVDGFLSALVAAAPADAGAQALLLSVARKGLLARVAGELNGLGRTSTDPVAREMLLRLEAQRRQLAGLMFRPGGDEGEVRRARTHLGELETALATRLRPRRSGAGLPDLLALRRGLAYGEALVDFQVYRDPPGAVGVRSAPHLLAVVLRQDGDPVLVRWDDLAPITAAVARYRTLIDPQGSPVATRRVDLQATAATLTRLLWQPLEPALNGITKVALVPDGFLSLVPFHALPMPDGGYLTSRLQLALLASPRDLALRPASPGARKALIVGAPDYGATGGVSGGRSRTIVAQRPDLVFEPLAGALEESRKVAAIVRPTYSTERLTGDRATEAALYKVAGPAVLHLATHGFFLNDVTEVETGDDPMQALAHSGVSLARANLGARSGAGGSDDGILTALEATTLDLRGTRLVVLSACDTGIGQIETGEGVYGLVRAFSEAGAQTVLATLWPVDDEATREFMLGFYRRFIAGEPPQTALRAMQLEFIRSREWSDPHYWAPFVLTGR